MEGQLALMCLLSICNLSSDFHRIFGVVKKRKQTHILFCIEIDMFRETGRKAVLS